MEEEKMNNSALGIAGLMAEHMRPAGSPETEMLDVVAKYSLQIRPDQHYVLNRLQMLVHDKRVPENTKQAIEAFIPIYTNMKRYHDTLPFIGRAIEAMSLKKFIEAKSIQGQVMNVK